VWGTALHPQLKLRRLEGPPFGNGSPHLNVDEVEPKRILSYHSVDAAVAALS
jgi:hypothetical protein